MANNILDMPSHNPKDYVARFKYGFVYLTFNNKPVTFRRDEFYSVLDDKSHRFNKLFQCLDDADLFVEKDDTPLLGLSSDRPETKESLLNSGFAVK